MNAKTLLFKNYYWDHLHESFENYCYNFFDESYESDSPYSNAFLALNRIPLFIVFLVVFHFQFLMAKNEFHKWEFQGDAKTIKLENAVQISTPAEPKDNFEATTKQHEFPVRAVQVVSVVPSFASIVMKIPIYTTNCSFLN